MKLRRSYGISLVMAVSFALAACSTGSSERQDDSTTEQAPEEQEPEEEQRELSPSSRKAFRTCLDAMRNFNDISWRRRVDYAVTNCKVLWKKEACRSAWEEATESYPEKRASIILAGCTGAYCPELEKPRPKLCEESIPEEVDLTSTDTAWLDLWTEFNGPVFHHDHGIDRQHTAGRRFARTLLQLVVSQMPAKPE